MRGALGIRVWPTAPGHADLAWAEPAVAAHGLGAFGRYRRDEFTPLGQPQPSLGHMREGDPRIPVAESVGHLEALLCASPILVCSTRHDPSPSVR
jgi:hypothetical protein